MPIPPNPILHEHLLEEARENLNDQLRTLGAPVAENTNAMAALTRRVMAMEQKDQSLETETWRLMKARHTATTLKQNFTFPHAAAPPPAPLERPPPAVQPAPLPPATDPGAELDNIAPAVLLDLMGTQTTIALARKLANLYFTKEERIPFNMNGTHGYNRLDPIRVEKLKAIFLHLMGAPAENQESLWAKAVVAIDLQTRGYRKKMRQGKRLYSGISSSSASVDYAMLKKIKDMAGGSLKSVFCLLESASVVSNLKHDTAGIYLQPVRVRYCGHDKM